MDEAEWVPRAEAHGRRVEPWVRRRLDRRARGESHAVEDFLFEYYPYSPAKLATWHPGHGVVLRGGRTRPYLQLTGYRSEGDGVTADIAALAPRRQRLDLAVRILEGIGSRPASTGCFGLHEWAMVYRLPQEDVRHASLPLRLPVDKIASTVDDIGLRCTHIDAFRFFTPEAQPLNAHLPTRQRQPEMDQPGCLHASMDLYKYAFWFSPLVPSDLVMDCRELATRARELDMRASPYDMTPFGLRPIRVETPGGRQEYVAEQRMLMEETAPLRIRLLKQLTQLAAALGPVASATGDQGCGTPRESSSATISA
ncbi:MAG: 3-methyladenine DNA glycosylase [Candidatus Nanopelagicales bacterium]